MAARLYKRQPRGLKFLKQTNIRDTLCIYDLSIVSIKLSFIGHLIVLVKQTAILTVTNSLCVQSLVQTLVQLFLHVT